MGSTSNAFCSSPSNAPSTPTISTRWRSSLRIATSHGRSYPNINVAEIPSRVSAISGMGEFPTLGHLPLGAPAACSSTGTPSSRDNHHRNSEGPGSRHSCDSSSSQFSSCTNKGISLLYLSRLGSLVFPLNGAIAHRPSLFSSNSITYSFLASITFIHQFLLQSFFF